MTFEPREECRELGFGGEVERFVEVRSADVIEDWDALRSRVED